MFNSQGMKLISGSVSKVCLMLSCVSLVAGIVLIVVGWVGGILITLLRCLNNTLGYDNIEGVIRI